MPSCAFNFSVRNSDIYSAVGGFSYTHADFIMYFQYLNDKDYLAYIPYGPEIEPSESNQGVFLRRIVRSSEIISSKELHSFALRFE